MSERVRMIRPDGDPVILDCPTETMVPLAKVGDLVAYRCPVRLNEGLDGTRMVISASASQAVALIARELVEEGYRRSPLSTTEAVEVSP